MMKKYLLFLFFAVGVFVSIHLILQAAEITHIKGNVQVQSSSDKQWKNAKVGTQVDINDSIRTARRSQAEITLDSEKTNFIRLEEQTLVILNSDVPGEINKFDLSNGKIFANIEEAKAGLTYEVSTPSAVAGVRGTGWSVDSKNKNDEVSVFESSVYVKAFDKMKNLISELTIPQGFKTLVERFGSVGGLMELTGKEMQRWRDLKQDISDRMKGKAQGEPKKRLIDKVSAIQEQINEQANETKEQIEEIGVDKIADERKCEGHGGHMH